MSWVVVERKKLIIWVVVLAQIEFYGIILSVLNRILWVDPFYLSSMSDPYYLRTFSYSLKTNSNDELQTTYIAMKTEQYRVSDTASVSRNQAELIRP